MAVGNTLEGILLVGRQNVGFESGDVEFLRHTATHLATAIHQKQLYADFNPICRQLPASTANCGRP
jgi:GAF domain-containing protein